VAGSQAPLKSQQIGATNRDERVRRLLCYAHDGADADAACRSSVPPSVPVWEKTMERYRYLLGCLAAAAILLVVGFITDLVAGFSVFTDHLRSVPLILATFTPWIAFFLVIAGIWATLIDGFFRRYNGMADRGISYELTHDNNTAAAVLLTMPILIMAVLLIAITILTR
jgi:hypothetical protein